jgi:hypothetical protein
MIDSGHAVQIRRVRGAVVLDVKDEDEGGEFAEWRWMEGVGATESLRKVRRSIPGCCSPQ